MKHKTTWLAPPQSRGEPSGFARFPASAVTEKVGTQDAAFCRIESIWDLHLIRHPPRGRSADATFPSRGRLCGRTPVCCFLSGIAAFIPFSLIRQPPCGGRRLPPSPAGGRTLRRSFFLLLYYLVSWLAPPLGEGESWRLRLRGGKQMPPAARGCFSPTGGGTAGG